MSEYESALSTGKIYSYWEMPALCEGEARMPFHSADQKTAADAY